MIEPPTLPDDKDQAEIMRQIGEDLDKLTSIVPIVRYHYCKLKNNGRPIDLSYHPRPALRNYADSIEQTIDMIAGLVLNAMVKYEEFMRLHGPFVLQAWAMIKEDLEIRAKINPYGGQKFRELVERLLKDLPAPIIDCSDVTEKMEPLEEQKPLPQNIPIRNDTPYSTVLNLRQILRACKGYIYWIDKNFAKRALEELFNEADVNKISTIKILAAKGDKVEELHSDFERFRNELLKGGITAELRIIIDRKTFDSMHGRWIVSENLCYKVPPVGSIFQNQFDEMTLTPIRPEFEEWWKAALPIIEKYGEILAASPQPTRQTKQTKPRKAGTTKRTRGPKPIDDPLVAQAKILIEKYEIEQNHKRYNIHRIVGMLQTTQNSYAALRLALDKYGLERSKDNLGIVVRLAERIKMNLDAWNKIILEDFKPISGFIKNAYLRDKIETKLMLIRDAAAALSRERYPYYTGDLNQAREAIDMAVKELDALIEDLNAETK